MRAAVAVAALLLTAESSKPTALSYKGVVGVWSIAYEVRISGCPNAPVGKRESAKWTITVNNNPETPLNVNEAGEAGIHSYAAQINDGHTLRVFSPSKNGHYSTTVLELAGDASVLKGALAQTRSQNDSGTHLLDCVILADVTATQQ